MLHVALASSGQVRAAALKADDLQQNTQAWSMDNNERPAYFDGNKSTISQVCAFCQTSNASCSECKAFPVDFDGSRCTFRQRSVQVYSERHIICAYFDGNRCPVTQAFVHLVDWAMQYWSRTILCHQMSSMLPEYIAHSLLQAFSQAVSYCML